MLTALRHVEAQEPFQGNSLARLRCLGYQPRESIIVGNCYLSFLVEFEDESELTGYIDIAAWITQALPALDGIDWLSVDEQVLPQLIAAYPLQFVLANQHAPIKCNRILAVHKDLNALAQLWSLDTANGVVLVGNFIRNYSDPAAAPVNSKWESHHRLSVPLMYILGKSALPVHALSALRVGDVLLVERQTRCVLSNNKTLFKFELGQESLMIVDANDEISQSAQAAQVGEKQSGLMGLPIELSFILMQKTVTLAELKKISPGEVVALPANAMMEVEIRANQRRLAQGELVQLSNGQLAVEIRNIVYQD